jgi:hypothetical protein
MLGPQPTMHIAMFDVGPRRGDLHRLLSAHQRAHPGRSCEAAQCANNFPPSRATLIEWPYRARVPVWEGFTVCPAQFPTDEHEDVSCLL